jgi:hypothetical protein
MNITAQADKDTQFFWKSVGDDVYGKLTEKQRQAIIRAVHRGSDEKVNSDIRLSFGRYFLVILFGRERRNHDRLKEERAKRPVLIARNLPILLFFYGSVLYTLYSLIVYGLDLYARSNVG